MEKVASVLLLSGGIDSVSLACWRRPMFALTIDYGQAAAQKEVEVATFVATELKIQHHITRVDANALGLGLMVGQEPLMSAPTPEWWPFRNQLLITLAAMFAIKHGAGKVLLGTVKTDVQHADGTEEFLCVCARLLSLQEGAIQLEAPCRTLTSLELVQHSGIPTRLLAAAHSCHTGDTPCGNCRGCWKHAETFAALGLI